MASSTAPSTSDTTFSNLYEWGDLTVDDVIYLLYTLPNLQKPPKNPIIKLLSALQNHPSLAPSARTPSPPPNDSPMLSSAESTSSLSELLLTPPQEISARGDKRLSKIGESTPGNKGRKAYSKEKKSSSSKNKKQTDSCELLLLLLTPDIIDSGRY
jgi:hypothetical protein